MVFVVDNVELGQASHQVLLFSSLTIFPQESRIHSCNKTLYILGSWQRHKWNILPSFLIHIFYVVYFMIMQMVYKSSLTELHPCTSFYLLICTTCFEMGTAVAQWLRCCATNRKVAVSIPAGAIGIFHWHKILPIAPWSWGRLSLWQKWVPGAFPGGKGGQCVKLITLPLCCSVVMKSGSLNFLEPSGPLQACNGIALTFAFTCFEIEVLWNVDTASFYAVLVFLRTNNRWLLIPGSSPHISPRGGPTLFLYT